VSKDIASGWKGRIIPLLGETPVAESFAESTFLNPLVAWLPILCIATSPEMVHITQTVLHQ